MSAKSLLLLAGLGLLGACASPTAPQAIQNGASQYEPSRPTCSPAGDPVPAARALPAMKAHPVESEAVRYNGAAAYEKSCQPIQ